MLALLAFAFVAVPMLAQRLLVPRDPDAVPDPVARGHRPQHPGRLLRADLARHRRLHGGRRLCGLQPAGAHRRHAADRVAAAAAGCARRPSACCSASRACASGGSTWRWRRWPRSSSSTGSFNRVNWVTNDSSSGSVSVPALQLFGSAFETPAQKYLLCLTLRRRVRAAGQEPGARRHRPRMDGDARHGRGGRGDRHPAGATPSSRPSR